LRGCGLAKKRPTSSCSGPGIIKAVVDNEIVPHETPIASARVVALCPPMTGG
jgi:molybdopterin converting factor small subunit